MRGCTLKLNPPEIKVGLHNSNLVNLVEKVIGAEGCAWVVELMTVPDSFSVWESGSVSRRFRGEDGQIVEREVPGSFYEFITRQHYIDSVEQARKLDPGFDAENAQGIFKMTAAS